MQQRLAAPGVALRKTVDAQILRVVQGFIQRPQKGNACRLLIQLVDELIEIISLARIQGIPAIAKVLKPFAAHDSHSRSGAQVLD